MKGKLKNKVREALDGEVKVLYSAVVIDEKSKAVLFTALATKIPQDWKVFAHHMTIVFGKGLPDELKGDLGKTVILKATEVGVSDMAIAVKVDGYSSTNAIPHITIAVNTAEGGKPYDSNRIENWESITPISLSGEVREMK